LQRQPLFVRLAAAQASSSSIRRRATFWKSKKPRKKLQVGSLTKIATASVVLDWAERKSGNLNEVITIPPEAFVGTLENNVGFRPGTRSHCVIFSTPRSFNQTTSRRTRWRNHVGAQLGSLSPTEVASKMTPVDAFVTQMNALAKQLKMERTRFVKPAWH